MNTSVATLPQLFTAERQGRWADWRLVMQLRSDKCRVILSLFLTVLPACGDSGGTEIREIRMVEVPLSPIDQACSERSTDRCTTDDACFRVSGRPLDRGKACWKAWDAHGCRSLKGGGGCGLALTTARDPNGFCYLFPDTCIPIGWVTIADSEDKLCHSITPNCEEVP
jgi:hypothetical protein